MRRSVAAVHPGGRRAPSGRDRGLLGPVPAGAWFLGGLGAGPWLEVMGVPVAAPQRRFSDSSRNPELPIMLWGLGGVTTKLLVVDDEPRMAEITAETLRRAGYVVDVVGSGTEALARARSSAPDLMLLDYEMLDMQAPEVLDGLRLGADRVAFPVIVLTGARHSPSDQVVAFERGAFDYIAKGTDREVLLARVRGALRERASLDRVVVRGRLRIEVSKGQASLG